MSSCPIGAALGGDRYTTPTLSRCITSDARIPPLPLHLQRRRQVLDGQGQLTAQAAWIQDFITTWRTLPGRDLHHPRPQHRQQHSPDAYGVYRNDCTPKPAADVIKGLA
jgi:hypothetical protein